MFYQNFEVQNILHKFALGWFGWLKIFYCKTNRIKWENIFLKYFTSKNQMECDHISSNQMEHDHKLINL